MVGDKENCTTCGPNGLKFSRHNGRGRVEVPQDFLADKLGSIDQQIAEGMAMAEKLAAARQKRDAAPATRRSQSYQPEVPRRMHRLRNAVVSTLLAVTFHAVGACAPISKESEAAVVGDQSTQSDHLERPEQECAGQCQIATLLGMSRAELIARIGPADGIVELSNGFVDNERTHFWHGKLVIALDDSDCVIAIHNHTDKWVLRREHKK
ncbi:MAG: hypothetical protein IT464_06970 [Planctomycetes bacterium]|nr:hypothetical protein [Planctomycetota bacterium]